MLRLSRSGPPAAARPCPCASPAAPAAGTSATAAPSQPARASSEAVTLWRRSLAEAACCTARSDEHVGVRGAEARRGPALAGQVGQPHGTASHGGSMSWVAARRRGHRRAGRAGRPPCGGAAGRARTPRDHDVELRRAQERQRLLGLEVEQLAVELGVPATEVDHRGRHELAQPSRTPRSAVSRRAPSCPRGPPRRPRRARSAHGRAASRRPASVGRSRLPTFSVAPGRSRARSCASCCDTAEGVVERRRHRRDGFEPVELDEQPYAGKVKQE